MTTTATEYKLCELMICAGAEAFADNGEVLATGIGIIPRLAASLAMKTSNPDLMMTDSEAWMVSQPNAISGRKLGDGQNQESWMGFSRILKMLNLEYFLIKGQYFFQNHLDIV